MALTSLTLQIFKAIGLDFGPALINIIGHTGYVDFGNIHFTVKVWVLPELAAIIKDVCRSTGIHSPLGRLLLKLISNFH